MGRSQPRHCGTLGIKSLSDLKDRDPEELYLKVQGQPNIAVDRVMLYVLRCAVYYASNKEHDPELLKWWSWKDIEEP